MKKLLLQAALLVGLASQPLLALADDDDDRRFDRNRSGALDWRLGEQYGRGYQIYYRSGRDDWRRAPGAALDMGDGWVIGTDRRNGGFGVYRWSGYSWQRMPGAGVDIGGSFSNPWIINDRGERFHWTGSGWREDRSYRGRGDRGRDDDRGRDWDRDNDRDRDRDYDRDNDRDNDDGDRSYRRNR